MVQTVAASAPQAGLCWTLLSQQTCDQGDNGGEQSLVLRLEEHLSFTCSSPLQRSLAFASRGRGLPTCDDERTSR